MTTHRSFKPSHVCPNTVFKDADNFLGKRESRKVQNHTYLQRRDSTIAIMFWSTDIVTYNQDGSIILNSGGYRTVTTSARMDEFNPMGHVCKDHGTWWYTNNNYSNRQYYEYEDRMTISPEGIPDTLRREIVILGEKAGRSLTESEAGEYVAGLELKQIKALVRNGYLGHFAIGHCRKEYVPVFIGNENYSEAIEKRLKGV